MKLDPVERLFVVLVCAYVLAITLAIVAGVVLLWRVFG
jgi:hypothetical protein